MLAFYIGTEKAATVNQVEYQINPARTAVFGQEGYLAHSKGAITTQITVNEVTPVAGSTFTQKLMDKILNQEDIDCAIKVGEKLHMVTMAVTATTFRGQVENGVADGSVTLQGGVPDLATI